MTSKPELDAMRSPFPTAEVFGIEEIIDPRETRPLRVDWVRCARPIGESQLGPKRCGCRP